MSKETVKAKATDENPTEERLIEVTATIKTRKEEIAILQESLKTFKEENSIKSPKRIKDKDVKAKYTSLIEEINTLKDELKKLVAEEKELTPKGKGGFGAKYNYEKMLVKDPESGEDRMMTKEERKKWRTKARRISKKSGGVAEEVPFDPTFMVVKPKAEKKKKPAKEEKSAQEEKSAKEEKPAKEKKAKKAKKAKKVEKGNTDD